MPLNPEVLAEMIRMSEEKAEAGHRRLRSDFMDLETRILGLESAKTEATGRLREIDAAVIRMATAPTDVTKLNFPPRIVLGVVGACLSIALGFWGSTYGLRSDVRNILTQMESKVNLDAANARILEERASNVARTIDTIEKKQELQRLEIQSLRETILRQRGQP